ncbi:MAG: hypothetical protein CM15mP103_04860 [Gammaproteobacteria bacterium]|nr:MAG: hypothetical protein CM15mP103_04860 [Gammaproteobacteria bacterium]
MSSEVLAVTTRCLSAPASRCTSGKVRSVYWLSAEDSARLIEERQYPVAPDAQLALMVISDRISAFDCIWQGEDGLSGVPGKGAALNAISQFWFTEFSRAGCPQPYSEVPHPWFGWCSEQSPS